MVAGAGYSISTDGTTASLGWGMVHPKLHLQGLGTILLLARLRALRLMPNVEHVLLDTSQHTQGFYARFGFVVKQVVRHGYGSGLDRWDMALDLKATVHRGPSEPREARSVSFVAKPSGDR